MNIFDIPLPKDTKDLFKKNNTGTTSNPYLTFNRFIWGWDLSDKSEPKLPSKNERSKGNKKIKLKDDFLNVFQNASKTTAELSAIDVRQKALLKSLKKAGYKVKDDLILSTEQRLVVGLGDTNALEVGLTLHPLYGFPYIPGSSLKGLCRSWLEIAEDTFENDNVLEGRELDRKIKEESLDVFGSADKDENKRNKLQKEWRDARIGDVLFFDAIPTKSPQLDIDIMTPHYGDYYQKPDKNPPGDWYDPNPIKFLTVAKGQEFSFGLASRDKSSLIKAKRWLISGLSELGIGAKTSSGYGYFLHPEVRKERIEEKRKKEEAERPEWALEKEVQTAEMTEKERILGLINNATKQNLKDSVYEEWGKLENEKVKKELASYIVDRFSNFIKKKKRKAKKYGMPDYLKDILSYIKE